MEDKIIKSVFFSLLWCSIISTSQAASPVCNTLPSGLYGYGQSCSYNYQCVTGLCSNSRCACASGTTYTTCAAACVSNCNTVITATSGTITNPGYPSSYSSGQCFWTIQATTGSFVAFNITYMDMGTLGSCSSNYLEIFDGSSTANRTFGKMCSTWQVLTLSTTNYMHVVFLTSGIGKFLATFKIQGRSINLQGPSGYIVSPGYPLSYLDNMWHSWTITGNPGTSVYLDIGTFELEGSYPTCSYDYLQVYDGSTSNYPNFTKYCENRAPGLFASTSNSMHIVFKTDGSATRKGFNATFYTQGRDMTLYESGKLASPGYPLQYLNSQNINWTLFTRTGTFLILNISFVETESCGTDYITVYDGSSTSARKFQTICGRGTSTVIASSTNYLLVNFRTDGSVTLKGFYGEFYSQATNNYMNGPTGLIISPGFPLSYTNNQYITWRINTASGTFIILSVNAFELGSSSVSCNDNLQIFDGPSSSSTQLARLCGNVVPDLMASTSNHMYIVFRTDSSTNYKGFRATYYTQLTYNIMDGPTGVIISPGFPLSYINNQYITWTINAASGTFIILSVNAFELGSSSVSCNDNLQIFDGPSSSSTQLARLCGNVVPGLIASTSNYMYIVFRTDSSATYTGFKATYYTKNINLITATSGSIVSPVNQNDQNNIWKIQSGLNTFIILSITSIDLGAASTNCSSDSLQIFDGPSSSSIQLARLCGNVVPGLIASSSNYMYLVLRIGNSYTYRGIRATYYTQGTSATLTASAGYIVSPGFPSFFLTNKVYSWTIQGNTGTFVVLNITTLLLSRSTSFCPNHHIQVYDGQNTSGVSLGRYCYRSSPVYVVSSSNYMHVVFRTDSTTTYKGFNSNYYTQACLNNLYETTGVITSSGYPNGYSKYSSCSWRIVGEAGTKIFVNITDFDVLPCESAVVAAYDGQYTRENLNLPLCGQVPVFSINASSNFVFIAFITFGLINPVSYRGFKLNYVIKDISYGKSCTLVDQCRSYLTCVSGYCSCGSDKYHNSSTLSCHNKLSFKEKCVETLQCRSNLQCLFGMCSCGQDYYYNPSDVRCSFTFDHNVYCNSSIPGMCRTRYYMDCLPDVSGKHRCLCKDSFHFENNACVSSSKLVVQRPQSQNKSTTGVELQWEATTLGPNRTYGVSWVSASDETDRGTQAPNESGVTVTGLTPGTSYTIRVYTFLQQQGFYTVRNVSTTINIVTYPATPGLVNTTTSKLDKPPYIIRFQPSVGRVLFYKFSLEEKLGLLDLNYTLSFPEIKLTDLQTDTEYKYSITAVNDIGEESDEVEGFFKTTHADSELNVGLIAGSAVGALALVVIIVVVVVVIIRRKQTKPRQQMDVGGVAMKTTQNPECTDGPIASTSVARNTNLYTPNPKGSEENVYEDVRPLSINKPPTQEGVYANVDPAENVYANQHHVYANAASIQETMS
ncbi:cubilin-like [Physella acuta]|uniref:cubilin-like n=1 Tax=Physella acuta TaxID=109671 RepID=UPI0027DC5154|nr:cubilin-like [Physella acuta]